jgi:putative transcriptional regulator
MKNEQTLHNRLKEIRANLGITQAELAELTGVSRKTINTVENEVFVPSTHLAFVLAGTLNMKVEEIFYLGN